MNEQPIVTVVVYTYNSSEFIIDTLESIRNQTYPNLMLVVSDDCSSDNTVEICKKWIEKNYRRFKGYKIVQSGINTGISANANRAWEACETEYIKDIAGDDVLLPNCIQDYVAFIQEHPEAIVVFSRVKPFSIEYGIKQWKKESWHNYSFFEWTPEEQYHYLIHKGNCLPAASCFYNIERLRAIGFRHDERIPLLEDYPKWIMLARKRIRFNYLDKHTVGYRINEKSLSVGYYTPQFFKSNMLLYLYYFQDEIKSEDDRDAIYNLMCDKVLFYYTHIYDAINQTKHSWDYKLGHLILSPIRFIKRLF